jgi:hypothetical protein
MRTRTMEIATIISRRMPMAEEGHIPQCSIWYGGACDCGGSGTGPAKAIRD